LDSEVEAAAKPSRPSLDSRRWQCRCRRFNTRRRQQQQRVDVSRAWFVVRRPTVVDVGHRKRRADRRCVVHHRVCASAAGRHLLSTTNRQFRLRVAARCPLPAATVRATSVQRQLEQAACQNSFVDADTAHDVYWSRRRFRQLRFHGGFYSRNAMLARALAVVCLSVRLSPDDMSQNG